MTDDRNPFGGELRDRVETAGAIERVPADHQVLMRGAQIVLVGAALTVDQPDLNKTVAGGLAHRRRPQVARRSTEHQCRPPTRQPPLRRFDEQHRQLALALELAQIVDRQPSVFRQSHAVPLSASLSDYARRSKAQRRVVSETADEQISVNTGDKGRPFIALVRLPRSAWSDRASRSKKSDGAIAQQGACRKNGFLFSVWSWRGRRSREPPANAAGILPRSLKATSWSPARQGNRKRAAGS